MGSRGETVIELIDAIIGDHGQLVALFNITRSFGACLCYVPQNIALGHVLGKASWLRLERTAEREHSRRDA